MDLEKLLIKDRFKGWSDDHHQRLEFINHEGHTFLAPINDKDSRISGVCKWEQAFRIYTAIYSKANPHRATEIWQYVHIINTAAACYIWDNISYYDYMFHQMMSINPNRNWGKMYNQLWNLAMTTPIQHTGTGYNNHNQSWASSRGHHKQNNQNNSAGHKQHTGKWKGLQPCWKFNKNEPCDEGCRFDHKCSYCGNAGHSVLDCPKLHDKKSK